MRKPSRRRISRRILSATTASFSRELQPVEERRRVLHRERARPRRSSDRRRARRAPRAAAACRRSRGTSGSRDSGSGTRGRAPCTSCARADGRTPSRPRSRRSPSMTNCALGVRQIPPRHVETQAGGLGGALELREAASIVRLGPRLDRAGVDRLGRVGHDEVQSSSMMLPNPWHVGHAPNGLLNENSRGCGTSYGMPHVRHSNRSLNRCVRRRRAAVVDFDGERRAVALAKRRLDRVGQPRPDVRHDLQSIDDHGERRDAAQRVRR